MLGRLLKGGPVSAPIALSRDDLFTLCRVERRRHAIAVMSEVETAIPMRTLVEEVTAREFGPNATTNQRTTVYTTFYQQHVSVLEDADVLSAPDGPSGVLYPGENAPPIAELLSYVDEISD
ncbi:DUF7344 domain-containing protein [Haladaptatus halobius]|uniref:DUF7344 domain-containing protein n=1 Tax=Haladaptatus halobius TaxID=2884875 RepID=UPI001D09CBEE|nr:hypothetical protein [Haladaptatus halobius]